MKIDRAKAGGMTVLSPKESLTFKNYAELEKEIGDCLEQYSNKIILDCKEIQLFDSEALEFLIRTDEELKRRSGVLKIVNLNAVCRDIFVATRLINTFHVYNDIHEALRDVI